MAKEKRAVAIGVDDLMDNGYRPVGTPTAYVDDEGHIVWVVGDEVVLVVEESPDGHSHLNTLVSENIPSWVKALKVPQKSVKRSIRDGVSSVVKKGNSIHETGISSQFFKDAVQTMMEIDPYYVSAGSENSTGRTPLPDPKLEKGLRDIEDYIARETARIQERYANRPQAINRLIGSLANSVGHAILNLDYEEIPLKVLNRVLEPLDIDFIELKTLIDRDMSSSWE